MQMGRYKWAELGLEYRLGDVAAPAADAVERACATFRGAGLEAF